MKSRPFGHTAKTFILGLVVGSVFGLATTASAAGKFLDDDGNIHEADIEYIAELGITKGCNPPANDRYCPASAVTRGEMAAFLARSVDVPAGVASRFTDTASSIFSDEIAAIAAAGITKGCNPPANDHFCPNDPVTRGQMAAFITRAFGLGAVNIDYFNDDDDSIFEIYINALANAGISVGCSPASYCPDGSVTRDQMASFIRRALTGGADPPTPAGPRIPPITIPSPGTSQPSGSIAVGPADSLTQAVANSPAGSVFYLTAGTHRMVYVRPKDNTTFVGAPGAILSGARILTNFTQSGGLWLATGQTQHNEEKGTCLDGYTGCVHPEQLFIDGTELWQVTSRAAVTSGTWYFDYAGDTIYIADNPTGRLVETSVTPVAFDGNATGVTIRDLVIEKYATPAQMGTIHGQSDRNGPYGHDWLVEGNEIRYNASEGVALGQQMIVRGNYIHHNGRTGVGSGLAEGSTIVGNEISYNCRGTGYLCFGWGGGGVKIAGATNTVMRSNYVHHNIGAGLHADVESVNTTFEANTVVDNDGSGIFVEVSHGATITGNRVENNGYRRPEGRGAGIVISASNDVTVIGNEVVNNALGIVAYQFDRIPGLNRLIVTENLIVQTDGHSGLKDTTNTPGYFDRATIEWDNNTYQSGTPNPAFTYGTEQLTTAQWLAKGHDLNSIFR